jgi:hypothetical protein
MLSTNKINTSFNDLPFILNVLFRLESTNLVIIRSRISLGLSMEEQLEKTSVESVLTSARLLYFYYITSCLFLVAFFSAVTAYRKCALKR